MTLALSAGRSGHLGASNPDGSLNMADMPFHKGQITDANRRPAAPAVLGFLHSAGPARGAPAVAGLHGWGRCLSARIARPLLFDVGSIPAHRPDYPGVPRRFLGRAAGRRGFSLLLVSSNALANQE